MQGNEDGHFPRFRTILAFVYLKRADSLSDDKEYRSATTDFRAGLNVLQLEDGKYVNGYNPIDHHQ